MSAGRVASVAEYALLGRSGLRVSPLALGTMTFGTDWGWGADESEARRMLDRYRDAGGNFVDTADGYTNGTSETLLGKFFRDRGDRDRVVLATKFTFNAVAGDPNAGGNGRKNVYRALEGSLRRLQTDYVDVYWLHAWDGVTPVEEVLSTFDALVRAGKVRAVGLSDVPAWYAARAQTLASERAMETIAAMQLEYSLVERHIEREHVPLAIELGIGICPWSPLGRGMLTGKYGHSGDDPQGEGRLPAIRRSGDPGIGRLFSERNWKIADRLVEIARELGRSPAQVALNWVTRRPGVVSTILGARTLAQLEDNLASLEFEIPEPQRKALDDASALEVAFPYNFFSESMRKGITGGTTVRKETPSFRPRES